VEYQRSQNCPGTAPGAPNAWDCLNGAPLVAVLDCPSGEHGLPFVWHRNRNAKAPGGWAQWGLSSDSASCPGQPGFPSVTAVDFQRLPLAPSVVNIQPPNGWTLANMPNIVYTADASQTLRTTVLGVGVTVRATPARFTWTFGDHSEPLSTTDPGTPYPNQTITHTYRAAGVNRIGLETQWSGEFLVDGFTNWIPITGTATTRTTSAPLTVYTARSHLVADPIS